MGRLIDARQIPEGLGVLGSVVSTKSSREMPAELYIRGYELHLVQIERGAGDPYVLYDRWGHIVYQWTEGFAPSWPDVLAVLKTI